MKRSVLIVLASVLLLSVMLNAAGAEEAISILINGKDLKSDTPPVVVNGRVMVPLRAVAEALNCEVYWNDWDKTVKINADIYEKNADAPDITGPDKFVSTINSSLNLIKEKDPQTYSWVIARIRAIVYLDDKAKEELYRKMSIDDDVVAFVFVDPDKKTPTSCMITEKYYTKYSEDYSENDLVLLYAGIIVHETTHLQLNKSIRTVRGNDEEFLCNLSALRVLQKLDPQETSGAYKRFKDHCDSFFPIGQ